MAGLALALADRAYVIEGGSLTFVSGVYAQRPQPDAVLQGALNARWKPSRAAWPWSSRRRCA